MSDQKYNGWTNYETWVVKLWMDNSAGDQAYWSEMADDAFKTAEADGTFTKAERAALNLMDTLKDRHESIVAESAPQNGFIADLLGAAMSEVNWYEIAESLLEDVEETAEA